MKLDKFISGDNVDLCIPTQNFAEMSDWYSWFNNSDITKYLEKGLYPNTRQEQKKFLNDSKDKLILMILVKNTNNYIGTISLSNINHEKKICDVALVLNLKKKRNLFSALESIALITEHAFEKLGIQRISTGQSIKLLNWQNLMELVGYKLEGIHIKKFRKGNDTDDSVSLSCIFDDYLKLKKKRGRLFDGNIKIMNRLKKKKKIFSYVNFLKKIYMNQRKKYYSKIFKL